MTIVSERLVDDSFKVIQKVTGARKEDEKLIKLDDLLGATNESKISIANTYYEVEGTGTVTLKFLGGIYGFRKDLEMTGIDNYGLKPTEEKIIVDGDLQIITDKKVDKFSLMVECHKEEGFEE